MTNMHYTFNILNIIIYIIIKYWPLMTFGMFDIIGSFYIHDSEWERPSKATLWFHFRFKTCLTNDDGQYHQHRMLKPSWTHSFVSEIHVKRISQTFRVHSFISCKAPLCWNLLLIMTEFVVTKTLHPVL